ncbi:odorant receptor 46a-like isoform X2 [Nomia melanderi]|uniref:odorant receptor 46a-like isoform X2 n=1 Tax=Nomia melanderi TaxID=2448451 RepID=UPI003FCEE318
MAILEPAFKILIIGGCWQPAFCSTGCKRILYASYTVFVLLLMHTFGLSQLFNVILNVKNTDDLSDSLYMFIATVLSCFKIVTILMNHKSIGTLCETLRTKPCKPRNYEEETIQREYDSRIGSVTIFYMALVEITVFCMILSSLLTDFRHKKLAYNAWLPFNYSGKLYYVAYIHQLAALTGASVLNVGCDVIFCGLCVHVCSQLEILQNRLKELPSQDRPDVGTIVRFHEYLYGYVSMMQDKFKTIISVQLMSSTLVVCFILYQLTNTPLMSFRYLQFVMYMACMMAQVFFYCWYGNELMLKSVEIVETICEIDWTGLDNKRKKSLITIMKRAMIPIELTSAS